MAFIEYQEHFETFAAWREWREAWSPPWICQLDACKVWHPSSQSLTQWWESGVNTWIHQNYNCEVMSISYSEKRTYENDFRQETNQNKYLPMFKTCPIFGGDSQSQWLPVLLRDKITRICNSDTDPSDICQGAGKRITILCKHLHGLLRSNKLIMGVFLIYWQRGAQKCQSTLACGAKNLTNKHLS